MVLAGQRAGMASVEYSDKNQIYYVLAGTEALLFPEPHLLTRMGFPGLSSLSWPRFPGGGFRRFAGRLLPVLWQKEISVEKVCFGLKAAGYTRLKIWRLGSMFPKRKRPAKKAVSF